jgi:fluoroacetyl-CoA thioesterase
VNPTQSMPVGATGEASVIVTPELTVGHGVPGMPLVYGTPFMIWLMEVASYSAAARYLPDGWVSVGTEVNIRHLAATPVGRTVTAKAKIIAVSERAIRFAVRAHDGVALIGEGIHVRAPVELARFERRMRVNS